MRPRLVPIAEFDEPQRADAAWARLEGAGIPASVVSDPGMLGETPVTRVWVESQRVAEAQRLIADLVVGP